MTEEIIKCVKGESCIHCGSTYCRFVDEVNELEQENKELKIYIESNKQQVEEAEMLVMDNDRLQQEVENLKDIIYYDVEKYRSALEEIREIVTSAFAKQRPYKEDFAEIETKINEVLNEKEL